MTVRKLSSHVRSQLQSGLTITDATQCVLELVENSLDAEATAIAVRVNLSEFTIEVVDNGTGISPQDLKLIGKRYMTSKFHNFDELNKSLITYGYKGQALASITEICRKVSIKTRYKMNKETMIKIFRNAEPPSLFVSSKDRSDKGTTVTVDGFMSTMPVRRKRIFEVFDLEDIKSQMEYLAIIHTEVCFTLRDENKGKILLQTHKKTNPGFSLRELFGLASDKFFIPFNHKEKNIVIEGQVSLIRHSENNLKFLYVNNRIVLKSMVHKLVDLCIDKYFKDKSKAPQETPGFEGINLNLPKDKHNVYIVKIFCPYTYFVMFRNLRKTTVEFRDWDAILSCIKRALKTALYLKSPASEPDKIVKIPACFKKVTYRNEQAVGNLNCGLKGGLVKRNLPCGSAKPEEMDENPRRPTEGLGFGKNKYSECKALSKSDLAINHTSKPHAHGHVQAPKILSESPVRGENYLNAKDNSATESTRAREIKNTECTDFLDFLAWLRCRLKEDSEIYDDFLKHRHNFQNRGINNCSDKAGEKILKNKKSLANKTKYKVVHKRKEEGNRKKEIKNSTFARKSMKTGNTVVMKQLENDRMKRVRATKRSNRARHSVELDSKKLKVREVGNNSSEDLVLSESQNIPRNTLQGCWFSHQNRIHLVDDDDMQNSTQLKLNIDESKENKNLCKNKFKFKVEETQAPKNVGKGSEDNAGETNLKYKDFGVQTDKALVIAPSSDKPNTRHRLTLNSIPNGLQCDSNSSLRDKEPDSPVNIELPEKRTCHEAGVFSTSVRSSEYPRSSWNLNSSETVTQEFTPANRNAKTMSVNDSHIFYERPSNKLSRGAASEMLNDFPHSTDSNCGTGSKLALTDPLNFSDFNRGNGRTVSWGRWSGQSKFTFTERYNFMPKGLSQSALERSPIDHSKNQEDNDLVPRSSPFISRSGGPGHISILPCSIFGELQEKTNENMIYYEKAPITVNLINNKAELSSLGTVTINKEGLFNITVLGQWDKKFILATVDVISSKKKKFLAIFDQHAVDERIVLEQLLKEFRTSDGRFVSVCFDPPIKCIVKESVARSIPSFENKLIDYGIKASVADCENVLLHEIPLCFADNSILEKAQSFFQKLLSNLVEEFNETRGTAPAIPKLYYDVISTKACRNAVKFNDILSNSAMKKMMNDLVKCQIPFQCAHGRPCIFPILDIEGYKRQVLLEYLRRDLPTWPSTDNIDQILQYLDEKYGPAELQARVFNVIKALRFPPNYLLISVPGPCSGTVDSGCRVWDFQGGGVVGDHPETVGLFAQGCSVCPETGGLSNPRALTRGVGESGTDRAGTRAGEIEAL